MSTPPKHHTLKTWPVYFQEVIAGNKRFEVRKNDRDFVVGDYLILLEWDPATKEYTGRRATARVTYLTANQSFVLPGFVIMSIDLEQTQ